MCAIRLVPVLFLGFFVCLYLYDLHHDLQHPRRTVCERSIAWSIRCPQGGLPVAQMHVTSQLLPCSPFTRCRHDGDVSFSETRGKSDHQELGLSDT
jgi:hypothetical protein